MLKKFKVGTIMIMPMNLIGTSQMILTIITISITITIKVTLTADITQVTTIWEIMTTIRGTLTGNGKSHFLFLKKTTCPRKERTF